MIDIEINSIADPVGAVCIEVVGVALLVRDLGQPFVLSSLLFCKLCSLPIFFAVVFLFLLWHLKRDLDRLVSDLILLLQPSSEVDWRSEHMQFIGAVPDCSICIMDLQRGPCVQLYLVLSFLCSELAQEGPRGLL